MEDDLLDDLLRDSDDEDQPTSVEIPKPKAIVMKNRLCSPVKKTTKPNKPGCLGMFKGTKEETTNSFSDPFFGIRVKSGVVDMDALTMLCKDMTKVGVLSNNIRADSSWMSVGVVVEKSAVMKSSNGNEYMIWKLHDLKNCEDKPRKMLLFGDCVKEHWKLQKGSVIAVISPQMITDDKSKEPTLKVSKSNCIVHIGSSVDLGKCKGKKQDGTPCAAFVNQSKCEMCVYHAAGEVRKLAARRGTFSQSILIPKKNDVVNPHLVYQAKPKTIVSASSSTKSKEEVIKSEKDALTSIVSEKTSFSLGARCLASLSSDKTNEKGKNTTVEAASFRQFLNLTEVKEVKKVNERNAREEDAVKRALRILQGNGKKKEEEKKSLKRGRVENEEKNEEKTNQTTGRNRVLELLAKRSKHANEAEEMENEKAMEHLISLEKREAVESVATECTQLNEVKVYSCSICKYTARHKSEYCIKQGHPAKSHMASKRFFKCKECSFKASTYSLLPTRRCQQCKGDNWERVTMLQERKVILETEKLELRGEERTFVN